MSELIRNKIGLIIEEVIRGVVSHLPGRVKYVTWRKM